MKKYIISFVGNVYKGSDGSYQPIEFEISGKTNR